MKLKLPNITKATQRIIMLVIVGLLAFATITAYLSIRVASWFDSNKLVIKSPIVVKTRRVITVEKRTIQVLNPVIFVYPEEIQTSAEKKICETWGVYDCKTAIAVAKHEGLNHPADDFNINRNGTIDVGYFRINSVHFGQTGCSLTEVATEDGNINCAYKLWKEQGWNIWVAYLNESYLSSL
jgi:hypothetical protein